MREMKNVIDNVKVVPFGAGSSHISTPVKLIGRVVQVKSYNPETFYWVLGDIMLERVLIEGKKLIDAKPDGVLKHIYKSSISAMTQKTFFHDSLITVIKLFGESSDHKHIVIAGTIIKAYRLEDEFDKDDKKKYELFSADKRKV